jgi:hypothetical protein
MGCKVTIDVGQRVVMVTYYGEVHDAEILDFAAVIRSDPKFDPSFSEIVDFSQVSGGDVSTEAIRELSRRESIFNPTSMHVAIAPQPVAFGLTRMFQGLAGQRRPNVVVVRTMEEARKALGLTPAASSLPAGEREQPR